MVKNVYCPRMDYLSDLATFAPEGCEVKFECEVRGNAHQLDIWTQNRLTNESLGFCSCPPLLPRLSFLKRAGVGWGGVRGTDYCPHSCGSGSHSNHLPSFWPLCVCLYLCINPHFHLLALTHTKLPDPVAGRTFQVSLNHISLPFFAVEWACRERSMASSQYDVAKNKTLQTPHTPAGRLISMTMCVAVESPW